jgi:hypothetical protein
LETSRCIGQQENIAATIAQSWEGCLKKWAHNDTQRKDAGLLLMNRVHANGHLVTLLEGLPLSAVGVKKQQHVLAMNIPFTLLFSFQSYVACIKSPASAIASLLHDTELDAEAKDIVRKMLLLKSEKEAADKGKYRLSFK